KDLSVRDEAQYSFALKESEGNIVHDIHGRRVGEVSNPEWMMNDAYNRRYKACYRSQPQAGAHYNAEKKEIYYFNKDSLRIYNVRSGDTDIKIFAEPCPVKLVLGTNFIDTKRDKLYSYEVYYATPDDQYDGPTVASLDLNTYQWTAES